MNIFQNGHLECVRWMVSETEAIAELSCTREYPSLIHYAARYGQVTNVTSFFLMSSHHKLGSSSLHSLGMTVLSLCRRRSCCGCSSSCRNRQSLWMKWTRMETRPSMWQLSMDTWPVFRCVTCERGQLLIGELFKRVYFFCSDWSKTQTKRKEFSLFSFCSAASVFLLLWGGTSCWGKHGCYQFGLFPLGQPDRQSTYWLNKWSILHWITNREIQSFHCVWNVQ